KQAQRFRARQIGETPRRRFRDGQNALRRIRLRGGIELVLAHLLRRHASRTQPFEELARSRTLSELLREQGTAYFQWRAEQLVDGADSLCDEQPMALARFASSQIASEREKLV